MHIEALQPRQLKRGVLAWENVQRSRHGSASVWLQARHPDVPLVVSRAQVHAVADGTHMLYFRVIRRALLAVEVLSAAVGRFPGIFLSSMPFLVQLSTI